MRILLITNFFPPTHTAGTEKRTFGYASQLQELGHEVQVVCAGDWEIGDQNWNGFVDQTYKNVKVRRFNLNWKKGPNPNQFLYCNPTIENHLQQWLNDWRPEVVHITSCLTLSASVIQAVNNCGIPLVLTLTDYWFICPRFNLLRGDGTMCDGQTTNLECLECQLYESNLYRGLSPVLQNRMSAPMVEWASRQPRINRVRGLRGMALNYQERRSYLGEIIDLVDRVTAPSRWLREIFYRNGFTREIEVIYSGHDLEWLDNMPERNPSARTRIGFIGLVMPSKGVHVLFDAYNSVARGSGQLDIYGGPSPESGDYMRNLVDLSHEFEDVTFHGPFAHERLGEVLSEIDILVVPSTWQENNPRVIQEAFASGTPVVASDVGGIAEFVSHEVNGLLFKSEDVEDLARQLGRILEEAGLIEQLRDGIRPVKTIQQEVRELEAVYSDVILQ